MATTTASPEAAIAEASLVADSDIVREIGLVLNSADLSTTSMSDIRAVLEKNLGVELAHKKDFIRQQVDEFLAHNTSLGSLVKGDEEANATAPAQEEQQGTAEDSLPNDQELEQFRENIELAIEDSTPKEKKKRGGLNKLCRLSPELQAIIGEESLPRTQVVKQLWVYIRAHNLQDPENKRNIICDDPLRELFGTDQTDMFQMNKLLSKHIWTITEEGAEDSEPKTKRQKKDSGKGKASGFLVPSPISDALQKFFGTGESEVTRSEVVKRIWDYIRSNQLQDPTDKKKILCDNKLQELFECDSFLGFTMPKLLASHFVTSS
ncbi:hypothetical protein SELMODRAFT_419232 [Selaginella moellendorffii]|uniref:DM2 domain-containing protein n=1 Tax=Selaginella moellendorffii TaxID=88036 RepID=D8S898_SELML|nr:upstream activation factor subunit spp27 [Selaginella moellendorffii]XP_024538503.1 upstream activation factor subunit spp27 isoform X2 [Selaginella moellendorffii]EFJ19377.1 hypothetical protein SELMODRAFT_419232 [Selaginella moellendorffii]|eukprot:XP_002979488.1 upstream activation factor subunit spp27 [Selaginella moellendorffii]